MSSICGLLVINQADALLNEQFLDDDTWSRFDSWVVSCASARVKDIFGQQGVKSGANVVKVIVEPLREARFRKGLRATAKLADYAVLFMPGTVQINRELPPFSDNRDAASFQYVGRRNQFRWRRMLVRTSLDWYYDDATAQWESSLSSITDTIDKKTTFRENPKHQHTLIEWANQLHAQCNLLRDDQKSQHLLYEIGLSYLRLNEPDIAYDWFAQLAASADCSPVHKAVALTVMQHLNKLHMDAESRMSLCRKAIETWPNLADSYFYLAALLLEHGRADQALEIAANWQASLTAHSSALDCTMVRTRLPRLLAQCHAKLGQYEKAIARYNQALHINNEYYSASSKADSQAVMHQHRDSLYELAFPLPPIEKKAQNHFKIIVAFWNAADFLENCVGSIADQKYRDYEVIFVDDVSTDGGLAKVDLSGLAKHRIITQQHRQGPLRNQIEAVLQHCEDDDIVVVLDGDDQLSDQHVLTHLNDVYSATDCWVTLGQFRVSDDWRWGYARPILPDEDISKIFSRQRLRFPVHLRSHRAGLLHRLQEQDGQLKAFKDEQGNFFFYASDVAYCRAIMSLAGARKIRYISRILMDYNVSNPLSVHQKNRAAQTASCIELARMPPISPVSSYLRPRNQAKDSLE